jgi:hypothetical protein
MAVDEKLRYIFEVKGSKQVETAFQGVGKSAQDAGTKTQGGIGKISNAMSGFASKSAPFLAAGVAIGAVAKKAVDAASDIAESQSKVMQIFGESGDSIIAWSKTTADSLGMSRQEALDSAASFAGLGKAAGLSGVELADFSTKLSGLAADLGSFWNADVSDVSEALGAALRGEAEPMRRYNVLLNDATLKQRALSMGIIATTKQALTPQQKILVANAEIWAQTTDQQGDYQRTSDGLANSTKSLEAKFANLQVQIGEKLVPAMSAAVQILTQMVEVAGPAATALGKVADAATEASNSKWNIKPWEVFADAWNGVFGDDPPTFVEMVKDAAKAGEGASATMSAAVQGMTTDVQRGNHAAGEFNATLREQANAAGRANGALSAVTEQLRLMEVGWQSLTDELDAEDAWARMTAGFTELADKMGKGKATGAELEQQTRDLKREVIDYGKEVLDLPLEHVTKLLAQIDAGAIAEVEAQLRVLTRNRTMNIDIQTRGGAGYGGRFQSFDTGGVVQGPRGSAQLVVAHAGETILPTHKTGNAGGGRAVNVTVNAGMGANGAQIGREVVEAIRQYERAAGSGWRN